MGVLVEGLALRNLSPLSIKQNEQAVRLFIAYLEAQKIKSIHAVGRGDFEGYIAQLGAYRTRKGTALCFNTLRASIFIIRDWFKFLRRKGLLHSDPAAGVRPPRVVRKLPRGVMSEEEIRRVMAQPNLHSILGYRDRAMMETLYSTGMREAELVGLALDDMDLLKKTARIRHGKGEKQRDVLLPAPCVRFLERCLKDIRPELVQGIRARSSPRKKPAASSTPRTCARPWATATRRSWSFSTPRASAPASL